MSQPLTQIQYGSLGFRLGFAVLLAAALVLCPMAARATTPIHLLKDIALAGDSDPKEFFAFNNQVFFQATDSTNGAELWVSDTTESGTALFANIAPDAPTVQGSFPANLTAYSGKLYFTAYDGSTGRDLWVTTGAAGDLNRLNVYPGHDANPKYLTVANGLLFFAADRGNGVELCHTDGTTIGTDDINPGAAGSFPADFVVLGSSLYFTADDGSHGREIWSSDGTATALLDDLRPGPASSSPSNLSVFKDNLYFAADNGVGGSQLWKSNGTSGDAHIVKSLTEPGDFALPSQMTPLDNILLLTSRGDNGGAPTGMELWWTDGTTGTLGLVNDILPGADGSNPAFLTAFNGSLIFSAADAAYDNELWISDGTAGGTLPVKDINPGFAGSQPGPFFEYQNSLYFGAETAAEGRELWKTDGTPGNTVLVKNINPESGSVAAGSDPAGFVEVRGRLVFAATTADNGREPWIVDYNSAPTITDGASVSVDMSIDGTPTAFSLTLHASDAESDPLTWSIATAAGHGTASASGTGNAMVIDYTPDTHYAGPDSFAVGVDDGRGGTATCTVSVTIATTVPNVVGLTQTAASTAITNAALVTGTVTQQYSNSVAAGLVISQNPPAGGTPAPGSAVNLVVSKGVAPPITGSIVINANRAYTNSPTVTLALAWAGGTGVVRMRFSNDGATWTAWSPLHATTSYVLPSGDGRKTVRVQYLDSANNRSAVFNDSIQLDTTAPTGTVVINDGVGTTHSQSVTLKMTWTDTGSGVTRMRFSDNGSSWSAWVGVSATYPFTLPAVAGYHTVRVQFLDAAGNYSSAFNDYIKLAIP